MSRLFKTRDAPDHLFRVGRRPDCWAWIDWAFAGEDGKFDNRWDDPLGTYRVLYASCSRLGAFLEALADYRPDLHVVAAYGEIEENDPTAHETAAPGRLPERWRAQRIMGRGVSDGVDAPLVDIGAAASLATVRKRLAAEILRLKIRDVDAATIRDTDRKLTQAISRFIYERPQLFAGVYYLSRFGNDVGNVAIFERSDGSEFPVTHIERSPIDLDDEDFLEACRLHGVQPS